MLELRLDVFLLNDLKKLECFPQAGVASIYGEASDNLSKVVVLDARNIEEAATRVAAVMSMTSNGFDCKGILVTKRVIFSCNAGNNKEYKTYFLNGPITLVHSTVAGVSSTHQFKLTNLRGEGQQAFTTTASIFDSTVQYSSITTTLSLPNTYQMEGTLFNITGPVYDARLVG